MGDSATQSVHRGLVTLGRNSMQGQLVGQVFALQALVGCKKGVHLAHRVVQDVAVAVTTVDQLGKGVVPSEVVTLRTLRAAC